MRICPKCRSTYAVEVRSCPIDGFRPVAGEEYDAAGSDPLLGSTLAERFIVVGRLGSGGMGTVYRAEQVPIGREVALKVLRRDLGRDPETVARFQREARALSQLKHPNTVTIFDFGQSDDGLLYLAMELLEGEMLSARLKSLGPLDVVESIRIATGVLRSLDEAHARHIVHRDLKPDNIFLARVHGRPDEAEMVKVVDFGIAKIRHGDVFPGLDPIATQEGTVFGTPRYMSPEQAQGKPLDGRSDLYAVGVLLFHMLTGAAPFTDDDAVIVMAHHIKSVPPLVRRAASGRPIPASLEALVARALAKDPDQRPQSAADFLAALEEALIDARALRTSSGVPPATASVPPPVGRRPWITALAAASVVLAIVVGFSSLARHQPPRALAAEVSRPSVVTPALPDSRLPVLPVATEVPGIAHADAPAVVPPAPVGSPSPAGLAVVAGGVVTAPAGTVTAGPGTPVGGSPPAGARSRRRRTPRVEAVTPAVVAPAAPVRPPPPVQLYHRWND